MDALDPESAILARLRARVQAKEQERSRAQEKMLIFKQELWDCLVYSGEDTSGRDIRHLNPGETLRGVKQLRADYDEACEEIEIAERRRNELLRRWEKTAYSVMDYQAKIAEIRERAKNSSERGLADAILTILKS